MATDKSLEQLQKKELQHWERALQPEFDRRRTELLETILAAGGEGLEDLVDARDLTEMFETGSVVVNLWGKMYTLQLIVSEAVDA